MNTTTNGNGNGQSKLIDKIRKLMALAQSPNEHEAASAAERAQALLAEHNLSMSDVTAGEVKDDQFEIDDATVTESVPWRRPLAQALAKMYFCEYFYTHVKKYTAERSCGYIRFDKHSFVGARHNILVTTEMFNYLCETIERLANEGALTQTTDRSSYRTSFKQSCTLRLVGRIMQRIADAKKGNIVKVEATGNTLPALASLYDQTQKKLTNFINEEVGKLRESKSRARSTNSAGIQDGRAAGDRIGLDGQVSGRSKAKLLG